jgi:two-component system, OmpR family, phosphate regulon sensor histidine kinase PhoR
MKKIFPIITGLVFLSLLGLIFFQFLWIKSAREAREQQFSDNINMALPEAAEELMTDKGILVPQGKKPTLLFSTERLQYNLFKPSVVQRFSTGEVREIIRKSFEKHNLHKIEFEFAIVPTDVQIDDMKSENFMKFYLDSNSSENKRHIIPLEPPSGSNLENISQEEYLAVIVPHQGNIIWKSMRWFIAGAILFTIIITAAFFITIRTLLRQKKLSEIKSDFINNMTHEFKTPLATISLAVDALKNEKVVNDREKTNYFTGIIKEENKRMNKQVETILQAALLDKQEVQLNLKKLSAHELIQSALNNVVLQVEEKHGTLEIKLDAAKHTIMADEVHFTNLVSNLLDNAIKYSNEKPQIKLSTQNSGNQLRLKIEDNGIGMNKETLSRIFEKFYRAHTGNIHNVKGFGLGLSYVKTMVDAHHGTIKAESVPGRGSSFIITMPLAL